MRSWEPTMATDFVYGLLPDLLVLKLIVVLMLLEMLRADARWARVAFIAFALTALAMLADQFQGGFAGELVSQEVVVDSLAVLGKSVLLLCGLGVAFGFGAAARGYKFWLL